MYKSMSSLFLLNGVFCMPENDPFVYILSYDQGNQSPPSFIIFIVFPFSQVLKTGCCPFKFFHPDPHFDIYVYAYVVKCIYDVIDPFGLPVYSYINNVCVGGCGRKINEQIILAGE